MREHYAYDKVLVAVECLATSHESLRKRLEGAADTLIRLSEDDFPPEAREPFGRAMALLTNATPTGGEGSIVASLRKMSDEEAVTTAKAIFDTFVRLDPKA